MVQAKRQRKTADGLVVEWVVEKMGETELVEIWEPERRYIWMKRWLETHRRRKAAGLALAQALAARPKRYRQLALEFF